MSLKVSLKGTLIPGMLVERLKPSHTHSWLYSYPSERGGGKWGKKSANLDREGQWMGGTGPKREQNKWQQWSQNPHTFPYQIPPCHSIGRRKRVGLVKSGRITAHSDFSCKNDIFKKDCIILFPSYHCSDCKLHFLGIQSFSDRFFKLHLC